jgi:hypothetical protein
MPYGPETYDGRDRNFIKGITGLATEVGTGTTSSAAVTINDYAGLITTEALTTAQNAIYAITLTNSKIAAGDLVFASVYDGTNTQGTPMIGKVEPGASTCTIEVINKHATAEAFNGTVKVSFFVVKAL